jgi:hypothetical protein
MRVTIPRAKHSLTACADFHFHKGHKEGAALPPLARLLPDRQGRVRRIHLRGALRRDAPSGNPASHERTPTRTLPLSASANRLHAQLVFLSKEESHESLPAVGV